MRRDVLIGLIIIYAVALEIYWMGFGGAYHTAIRDVIYVLTSFTGVVGGLYSLHLFGFHGPRARTIAFLTAGIGCWFIGEALWNYYELILHANPFPSIADVFFLLAYPLLFLGLVNEVKLAQIDWKKLDRAVIFLMSFVSVLLAGVVFYFGVYLAYDAKETLLTNTIAMGYGVGDLILIVVNMLILIVAWEFRGGKLSRTWLFVFIAFVITLIADILFAIYTDPYKNQVYFYKNFLDSLWMAAYLIFAYALFSFGLSVLDAHEKIGKLPGESVSGK